MQKNGSGARLAVIWVAAVAAFATIVGAAVVLFTVVTAPSAVPTATPTNDNQRAVIATVEAFIEAWREEDCAAYLVITTQREQEEAGITDCASFDARASAFSAIVADAEIVVTDVRGPEYQYTVETRERYLVQRDPDGVSLSEPQHVVVEYAYDVVPHDDQWAIYWWFESRDCGYWSSALTTTRGGGGCVLGDLYS
ncbi:hypothetical protein [Microbacterium sp. SLBN-146]|uniref:hypothetical protein n=1 Tax=Microbacterium sp. SLBN-146 TaxID=2768457 RepID=UPI00114DC1AF|nr:hypothetical protein [Microbacterium sp. SLBN-146]TQJ32633.1 hypothetical protein FBY39_3147 [Microbacterium sp. SLBN-146]